MGPIGVIDGEWHIMDDEPHIYWPDWLRNCVIPMLDLLELENISDQLLLSHVAARVKFGAWLQDELVILSEASGTMRRSIHSVALLTSKAADLMAEVHNMRRTTCLENLWCLQK